MTYEGLIPKIQKSFLSKDVDAMQPHVRAFVERAVTFATCPECGGTRLTEAARSSKIKGISIAALQTRLSLVQPQFTALVRRIRDRNEWDDAFVDALCTPPVSFTFGSVVAHILTVSVVRRQTVIGALRELGVRDPETRDPIEWERMRNKAIAQGSRFLPREWLTLVSARLLRNGSAPSRPSIEVHTRS